MPARKDRMADSQTTDSVRVLVATDNHVGYNERDPVRGNDSWQTFDEIMTLAKERDVDMVLLAGDLFHENKPSRKAMYQVMRSLRENCYGDKPCELQMLSDGSEHFAGSFNHVNYEDQDINVAIPVFSIHGNHDDPSGEGHLAALDLLAMSGLLNYYGRTPESDNIEIKPVLLQKGSTKLALYGMSNVRDERLFRTFRDGKVKFFQPSAQTGEFFNIMSVHQNHHAYTETSYLPEQFLPSFMDLIIWGHEHECKIDPQPNPEMGFKVIQPGSSVATSLVKGEAVPKHVAILTVTGTDFEIEPIRLKTVRPFIMKEIALQDYEEMRSVEHLDENRTRITQFLTSQVDELIEEAYTDWQAAQEEGGDSIDEDEEPPLPLIRLRVETSAPNGGTFEPENPQRFSNRFHGRVANRNDVVQYHKKRSAIRTSKAQPDLPEDEVMAQITIESVKVDKLVKEFLQAQALTILPQNRFSDAVGQFVDKDDKHAMEQFIAESLKDQQEHLQGNDEGGDDDDDGSVDEDQFENFPGRMEDRRLHLEEAHARGELRLRRTKGTVKPKPANWDSDTNGHWEDNLASVVVNDEDENGQEDDDDASVASRSRPTRGRGSRGGRGGKAAAATTRKTAAAAKKAPSKSTGRGKKKQPSEDEDDDDDDDVIMLDDDGEESQGLFVSQAKSTASRSRTQRSASPVRKKAPTKSTRGRSGGSAAAATTTVASRQTQLSFGGSSQVNGTGTSRANGTGGAAAAKPTTTTSSRRHIQISDDEISDDDAFEPPPAAQRSSRTGRR